MEVAMKSISRIPAILVAVCLGATLLGSCGDDNKLTGPQPDANGMVLLPPGTFWMGSTMNELGWGTDEVRHLVTLTKSFYMSNHETTQGEWQAMMGWNGSHFSGDPNLPVEQVTWFDAVEYCNRRAVAEGRSAAYTITDTTMDGHHLTRATVTWNGGADGYRLPTEAEWEYACRAGTLTPLPSGEITHANCHPVDLNLDLMGWYCGNAANTTHVVWGKMPNAWRLYDMNGNVSEWCWDWYGSYPETVTDPTGPSSGFDRVIRGGSWNLPALSCRSAFRMSGWPEAGGNSVGLRVARTAL